jgi:HEAT repeat protein
MLAGFLRSGAKEERISAARALGSLGDPRAGGMLVAAMADPEWTVRAQAARALGRLRFTDAAAVLEAGLGDEAWWVRANCGNALRSLGHDGIVALERALHSPDRFARDRAREALALATAEGVSP